MTMPVGQKLEEARKRKGASLREVSESTKIRGDYLSAIEAGNYEINLPEVYLRGFVRLYSKFLGLDQDAMVTELDTELGKPNSRSVKKSLGSIVNADSPESKDNISAKHSTSSSKHKSFIGVSKISLPIILCLIAVIMTAAIIALIYAFSSNDDLTPSKNSNLITEVDTQPDKSIVESPAPNIHTLTLSIVGNVKKLIVCDEGMSPPVFHEYDSLSSGWVKEIPFKASFRCYSTDLEKLIISVDGSDPQKVGGNRQGVGTFSWNPSAENSE
jgi:cytoskeleton protein RodZ